MIKRQCASCGNTMFNDEARHAIRGNFCDSCNARASQTAKSRQYKENYRHEKQNEYKEVVITVKDVAELRKLIPADLTFQKKTDIV